MSSGGKSLEIDDHSTAVLLDAALALSETGKARGDTVMTRAALALHRRVLEIEPGHAEAEARGEGAR